MVHGGISSFAAFINFIYSNHITCRHSGVYGLKKVTIEDHRRMQLVSIMCNYN